MENQIEEIKRKLDIVDIINRFLPLKKRGRHHVACCPFHSEKTPSFIVSPELQIFKCFGCGKAGDIFTFLQEYERITFPEALRDLAKLAGVTLQATPGLTDNEQRRWHLLEINRYAAHFYHCLLTSHPLGKKALDYLLGRGIKLETINLFQLGFSPGDPRLIVRFLTKKGFTVPDLIATGTFGRSQYYPEQLYDRFQDRLIFPLHDYRGRILGFSGRVIPAPQRRGDLAKYINSPETDLYHKSRTLYGLHLSKESIKKNNSVIVTEGEFDMIAPYQEGITNIVAIKGTAFTPDQLQLLHRYTDTLILALDSDFAGSAAATRSIELADSLGFDIKVLSLDSKYKDPDEAIRADPQFFKNQCQSPQPVWDFIINSALENYGLETIQAKKQVLSHVLPFLVRITNSVIRSDYYRRLANLINSDVGAVGEEAGKYQSKAVPKIVLTPSTSRAVTSDSSVEKNEEHLLILILSAPKPLPLAQKIKSQYLFATPRFNQVFSHLLTSSRFEPPSFSTSLPPETVPVFQNLYLAASSLNLDPHRRRYDIQKTIRYLESQKLKKKLDELSRRISQLEALGKDDELKILETEYNQLLARLSNLQSS